MEQAVSTSSGRAAASDRIPQLRARAARLREHSLRATSEAGSGHPTSCLSAADLVAALFFDVLRYDPRDPGNPDCDRFVLSKGHAAPLLYAAWAEAGALPVDDLLTLRRIDSPLEGHPTPHFPGTVAATGSLGQGLSVGVGLAWNARQLARTDQRIYVLCGDGEVAEGSVWEAIALAAHQQLDNLVAIFDLNGLQADGPPSVVMSIEPVHEKLRAFGWNVSRVDGNHLSALLAAFTDARHVQGQPIAIVCDTLPGKGVPSVERREKVHYVRPRDPRELDGLVEELEAEAAAWR